MSEMSDTLRIVVLEEQVKVLKKEIKRMKNDIGWLQNCNKGAI